MSQFNAGSTVRLPFQAGERVTLVEDKFDSDGNPRLRELAGEELIVIAATMGGGQVWVKHGREHLWLRPEQLRRVQQAPSLERTPGPRAQGGDDRK